jgi:hypothetical protein
VSETKTFILDEALLEKYRLDPLEAVMLNSVNNEAVVLAKAIIYLSSKLRFNPSEYRIRVVYEENTNRLRVYCDPKEEAMTLRLTNDYYGFVTPRAKFHSIGDALGGCSGVMASRDFAHSINPNW